jgi:DNA repair protein RadD
MLRPTLSTGLYVQQVGRGRRKADGKQDTLVLDFAGNVARHGPVDAVDVIVRRPGDGPPPTKVCPECDSIVALAPVCPDCGYAWPVRKPKHEPVADERPILTGRESAWISIREFGAAEYHKPGGILPTLQIEYVSQNGARFREWLAFEHDGAAKRFAGEKWRSSAGRRRRRKR